MDIHAIAPAGAAIDGARRLAIPLGQRAATVGSYDKAARTVEMVVATETRVRASGWALGLDCEWYWEILDCQPGSVDFAQVEAGNVPVLDSHNRWSISGQLGCVRSARTEAGQVVAHAAFGQSQAARDVEAEVAAGTAPKVSAGFRRDEMRRDGMEGDIPIYRVTRWTLCEASFVPIAADANAGVRSADIIHPCTIIEECVMDTENTIETPAVTQADAASSAIVTPTRPDGERAAVVNPARASRFSGSAALAFVEDARAFGATVATRASDLIAQNERGEISVEGAREAMRGAMAEAQRAAVGGVSTAGRAIEVGLDERDKFITGAVNSIIQRAGQSSNVAEADRIAGRSADLSPGEYGGVRNADLARIVIQRAGERALGHDPDQHVRQALGLRSGPYQSTSDFPVIMDTAMNRIMQAAYAIQDDSWREFCATGTVTDFREVEFLRVGTFSGLDVIPENGEIKNMPLPDGEAERIRAREHGKMIGLSRAAIVNDNLSVFSEMAVKLGRGAKMQVEKDVYAMLALNGGLGPKMRDGKTLFHADHKNIVAVGGPVSIDQFEKMDLLLGDQVDVSGDEVLDLRLHTLLLPRADRGKALIANNAEFDNDGGAGKFQLPNRVRGLFSNIVASARLRGTRRYAFTDPKVNAALMVVFLNGNQEPRVESQDGWRTTGTEWRVLFDYGVGAIDWRPALTDAGA